MGNKSKTKIKTDMSDAPTFMSFTNPKGTGTVEYATAAPTVEQLTIVGIETATPIEEGNIVALFGKVNSLFNFLSDILVDPNDIELIKQRLRNRDDALTLENVMESFEEYVAEQSAFPTQEPSGSSAGDTKTGGRSTGRIQPGE